MRKEDRKYCIVMALIVIGFALSGCGKYSLDEQLDELCSKDGGIKVYETVTLLPEMFDRWGDPFPGWRGRPQEERLGPNYRYVITTIYLKNGDPFKGEGRLDRTMEQIYRRSDGKLLGEAVSYGRIRRRFYSFCSSDV